MRLGLGPLLRGPTHDLETVRTPQRLCRDNSFALFGVNTKMGSKSFKFPSAPTVFFTSFEIEVRSTELLVQSLTRMTVFLDFLISLFLPALSFSTYLCHLLLYLSLSQDCEQNLTELSACSVCWAL